MRIDRHGVGIHEYLKSIFALQFGDTFQEILIALVQEFGNVLVVLSRQLELHPVVFDTLAPQFSNFGLGFRPRLFFPKIWVAFVLLEIESRVEQGPGISKALDRSPGIKIEDGERELQLIRQNGVVELGSGFFPLVDVGLNKQHLLGIERFQIGVEYFLRQGIVEGNRLVVMFPDQSGRQVCR
ncbi:MAG TPA: hypothetical protein VLU73_13695 [Methylococcaceae bacterium]|nr:hypothetical protein [Methylococcaceae bacterium]